MHAQLISYVAAAIPPPTAPSGFKTAAITGLLVTVVGLIFILQGIRMGGGAHKKKVSENAHTMTNMGMGAVLVVIGLAGTGLAFIANSLGFFTSLGG